MRRSAMIVLLGGLLLAGAGTLLATATPSQAAALVPAPVAAPTPLPTHPHDFAMPGTQPGALTDPIPDPDQCNICHTPPVYDTWRGSMMGQAGRDPLFWAALAVAEDDAPGSGEFCLRCHTPKGWLEGRSHGTDGSALTAADINAGVACEVCHRLVDPQPPSDATRDEAAALDLAIHAALSVTVPVDRIGSAMMIVDPADNRRGPFVVDAPHTAYQASFQGQGGDAVAESRLCGTCHNIDNPALVWTEEPPGGGPAQFWPRTRAPGEVALPDAALFPLERTYDEWLYSAYPAGVYAPEFAGAKPDGTVASCQDCHMPRQTGAAAYGGTQRDCGDTGCLPAHTLVGGNTWVPRLLQDDRWRLSAADNARQLRSTEAAARQMLQQAATLSVTLTVQDDGVSALVRVVNESGHKLPTGYAEGRRMWLRVRGYAADGTRVYASGEYDDATGELATDDDLMIYEVKQGLTPELAALTGLEAGPSFHFALNNTILFDNRIPPRGFTRAAFAAPGLQPVPDEYADGKHWDDVDYLLPAAVVRVRVDLLYQTASKEYIDFLRAEGGADGATLGALWDDDKSPPERMATARAALIDVAYLPLVY